VVVLPLIADKVWAVAASALIAAFVTGLAVGGVLKLTVTAAAAEVMPFESVTV
jgi:hypothetical protein